MNYNFTPNFLPNLSPSVSKNGVSGFSLVEVVIAFAVFLIVLLGVFTAFTYCVSYNAGNYSRAQALTVLQREAEHLRSAKFSPYSTDAALTGGTKPQKFVVSADGNQYSVQTIIDDDPQTAGVQTDLTKKFKEITITVNLESPTPGWQTAVPARTVLRRVRAN